MMPYILNAEDTLVHPQKKTRPNLRQVFSDNNSSES